MNQNSVKIVLSRSPGEYCVHPIDGRGTATDYFVMNIPHSLPEQPLKAMPSATGNSAPRLLTERTSATVEFGSTVGKAKHFTVHASGTTAIVKDGVDYNHYGIND